MPTGREIMEAAGTLLLDEGFDRWTLPEMRKWVNEAVKAVILAKPSAYSRSIVVTLQAGTLQVVPQAGTPKPLRILSVTRNITSEGPPRVAGRAIRPTDRTMLDVQEPNWHDTRYVRFRKEVRQYTFDEENPLEFYTYPGNDGTGKVEAVVSALPADIVATGDVDAIASYDTEIGLQDIYLGPLTDYVCYRAQLKDDVAANVGRAAVHYQNFATAVGLKIQVERVTSPNRER
jgi:hypothetical protein